MGGLQPWHWIVLAIVVMALFGYKKLPDATRSVGRSMRIFKSEMKGFRDEDHANTHTDTTVTPPSTAAPVVAPSAIEGQARVIHTPADPSGARTEPAPPVNGV